MTRPLTALLLFTLLAGAAAGLDVPPPPNRWYTDNAGLLTPTEGDFLNRKLQDFEQATGAQFIVYVFPALENESLEEFTIRAVERWKVGQNKYDNGLVLFVFVKERKVRVEVGYGLEGTITDAVSSRVIREHIAPNFSQGKYAAGLNAAADELMRRIRTGEKPVEPLNPRGGQGQEAQGEELGIIPVLIVLFVVFFVVVPMLRRGGGGCLLPLFFSGGGTTFGGGGFSSGGGFGGGFGGGGGFSGGGGGFGGGGASGGW